MAKFNEDKVGDETTRGKPRVLIVPLDWGLGHATRCIPVIYEFIAQGAEVILAGEGAQENLLRTEFPDLEFLTVPGYRIKYAKSGKALVFKLLMQIPRLISTIREERTWLKEQVARQRIDLVISDNRYGLSHRSTPVVFITHQLQIQTGLGSRADRWVRNIHYRWLKRYRQLWVPDDPVLQLSGRMGHPDKLPSVKTEYTGILSRFRKQVPETVHGRILIIISGPEPQRSILEEKILVEISHYPGTAVIVRGLPGNAKMLPSTGDIRFYNHLPGDLLNKEMEIAELVISRSGYSTIMDLVKLGKRSVLVPTPGQTEQEYLGQYLEMKGYCAMLNQDDFSLKMALEKAASTHYQLPELLENTRLTELVTEALTLV